MIGKIIMLLILAGFVALGFVFRSGKGAFLIAGYNTSSESEKAKIDEKSSAANVDGIYLVFCNRGNRIYYRKYRQQVWQVISKKQAGCTSRLSDYD